MTDTTGTARDPRCSATAKSGARSMNQKRCTKCAELKALSEFRKDRSGKNGLRSQCKACAAAYGKQYRAAHPDYHKRYREGNYEDALAREKHYRDTHSAQRAAYNQRWRAANPDYRKHYNDTHKEERAASNNRRRALKAAATIEDFDIMEVWEREGYTCAYCGSTENLTIDHIVALADGGSHSLDNLTVACMSCNSSKGAKPLIEWLLWKTQLQMQLGQC